MKHAVLMGDLINSEQSPSIASLHATFNAAVAEINRAEEARLLSPLTITLGDEFQGLPLSLSAALSMARALRFDMISHDIGCRFVIGLATIETQINRQKAWNMMGPGLADARAALNDKSGISHYRFSLPTDPIFESMLNALGAALSMIERGWTKRQREDITASLDGHSPAAIAQRRNVSAHSIYKVRSAGNMDLYQLQWDAIQKALAHLDRQNGLT